MDNKGFTLIELLATVVILSLIMALAIPSISSVSNAIRTKQKSNLIKKIEIAASKYAFDTNETSVFVGTLLKEGYLESNNDNDEVIDPISNKKINCYVVTMQKKNDYYVAKFNDSKNYEGQNGICDVVKYEEDGSITINSSVPIDENNWIRTSGKIILSVDEPCEESDCYWTSNKGLHKLGNKIEINVNNAVHEAIYTFHLRNLDSEVGEIKEKTASINLKIDNESPTLIGLEIKDRYVFTNAKEVTITASDKNGSGVNEYYFGEPIGNKECSYSGYIYQNSNVSTITSNGKYKFCAKDKVGNCKCYADITINRIN